MSRYTSVNPAEEISAQRLLKRRFGNRRNQDGRERDLITSLSYSHIRRGTSLFQHDDFVNDYVTKTSQQEQDVKI